MNFLEALAKNEKTRTRVKTHRSTDWYAVGEMAQMQVWQTAAITAQWEAEPEKCEGVTTWDQNDSKIVFPLGLPSDPDSLFNCDFKKFIGKRTKLTIEILD